MKKQILFWAAASVSTLALFACTSNTTETVPAASAGPPIAANLVGSACSGVGTSPGDSAIFAHADCPAGLCVADARTGFDSYCTADCEGKTCPTGFSCEAISLGDTKHACLKSGTATSSPDAGADTSTTTTKTGPIGTKTDKGVKSVDVNISTKGDFTCTDACKTAGGTCDMSGLGNGVGWVDRKYNDGSGTTGDQISSCDEYQDYYSGNTTMTGMSCFCAGLTVPTTVTVKKSEALVSCATVCTSWSLKCSPTRKSESYADAKGTSDTDILCATIPPATVDHYVCACD